ncbi:YcnI family copper-binding membrane protein [Williamsia muralis]|uniref:YcnI family protein n=1 Tax=Williamsia marianensis TaxID=85044 RepID=A0ABU4EZW1_WILMA|nr:YcnI family protein [Williamsia muralis]MDV7136788.1 YcnI family protein [Williamsia muralis]
MTTRRTLATIAISAALLISSGVGVASAHVSVSAPDATQGGYTKVTFRVPSEKDVPTTKLELAMPTDTPIASVRVQPQPGWTYTVTKEAPQVPLSDDDGETTEVVSRVVWTATNGGIQPGEFDEFNITAGPLPDQPEVTFKILQTYSDGEVVSWIEEQTEGAEEPAYPAPVLALAAATEDTDTHGMAAGDNSSEAAHTEQDNTATALSATALAVGVVALLAAVYTIVIARKKRG